MDVQIQENINDVIPLFEERTSAATMALAELQQALVQTLFTRLEEATASSRKEAAAKAGEAATLRASHAKLCGRVEAQSRVLAREIDVAVAGGDDTQAAGKRAEIKQLTDNLADILARANAAEHRLHEIVQEQQQLTREVSEKSFEEIRRALVSVQQGMVALLDGTWAGIERYAEQSGLPGLVSETRRVDLTARERGEEKPLFYRLLHWFGGRS